MAKHNTTKRNGNSGQQGQKARSGLFKRAMVALIAAACAFSLGFFVRGESQLLHSLGFVGAGITGDDKPAAQTQNANNSLGSRIAEVEKILDEDSVETYELDSATSALLEALATTADDPYMRYYTPLQYDELTRDVADTGSYSGVGVLFAEYNGRAYAVDVFDGSPAQQANVQEGDVVVAIDGNRDHDWTIAEVTTALKRSSGQDVVITWRHPASLDDTTGPVYTTTLACEDLSIPNIDIELIDGVGYIKLRQITQTSSKLMESAFRKLDAQGAIAYVIDVRDNPGGFLTQAVNIADLLLRSGTIVRIETQGADDTTKSATTNTTVTDKPVVVLVNGNTAASAEVLTAALQDNQRATVVGQNTLGKGSVQVTRELSFGGALRYTAAFYKSPLDYAFDKVGIMPDITVKLSETEDNQLAIALETAQNLASSES